MDNFEDLQTGSLTGRRIGVYRLEEEIGRGGAGAVYRAERIDGEFRQTVAIKLIKRGMDTDMILKRFKRERQILASLNHPNIASFLGGGTTDDGLPYFVMEHINGKQLYTFCDENTLGNRERLMIFREMCYAVIAAHRMQIIHRDIKPSNILVRNDRKPKLLDFGIAKVLDPNLAVSEMDPPPTLVRGFTPEYASPEQISGGDVGPASDIYSLGVILYELLTGHRPYHVYPDLPHDAWQAIKEAEPTNPSAAVTQPSNFVPLQDGTPTLERIFQTRGTSAESLRRELIGDLDKVILKALRKDPAERYETAADLANDVINYLEGRPVKAEFHVTMHNVPRPSGSGIVSVAILPFKVVGSGSTSNTGDDFLGIGLADALISRLSGVQRLVVRPTSSVLPFSESDPAAAGQELAVDFVLDGNVRYAGDRIRVSVQLFETAASSTQWAKAFDASMSGVLGLEEELSDQVARSLLPQLTGEERKRLERRGTNNIAAYQAYLRGRYFWSRFTDESLLKAVDAFNEAISLDPNYAYPYIGLADYYTWSAVFGEIPSMEGFPKAQEAAKKALEIDDSLGEAYAALAFSVFLHGWNWADAEYLVRRAIEFAPNYAFAHECFSNFMTAQGRFTEGVEEILKAEELDPMSPRSFLMSGWTLYHARRYDEAVAKAEKAVAMQNDFPQGLLHVGNALIATGRYDEAITALRRSCELWPHSGMPKYLLCFALAQNGLADEARAVLDEMLAASRERHFKPYFIAMGYAALGERDKAFEWFERAIEEKNEWMIWFGVEPKLDPLRSDPRYQRLLERTGNPLAATRGPQIYPDLDTAERERSIAVLPFKMIAGSDTASDEYLGVGLADALTMRLSNIRRFIVRPTSSVLQFGRKNVDPFEAGRELAVEFIVDGIIRHVGDKIRVTAQLLNVSENSTRWSASFSERSADVLELEDSISEQVTRSLVPHLTGEEQSKLAKRGTDVPAAHDAYLQGRYFWNQFTTESFPKAIEAFNRAAKADPNYALAYVGIADYYTWACIYGMFSPAEGFPKVFEYATKAVELDPELAEANAALGLSYSNMQQWEKAEQLYRKAIELNPSYPLAHEWLASVMVGTGRFKEGSREVLLAEQLDPLSLRPKVLSAWTLYQARDFVAALAKAREMQSLSSSFMQTYLQLANILTETGPADEALKNAKAAVDADPGAPLPLYGLCFALVRSGLRQEAEQLLEATSQLAKSEYIPPYFLGMMHTALGNADEAISFFEAARDERSAWVLWLATEPKLDPLRTNPRFAALVESLGLPELKF